MIDINITHIIVALSIYTILFFIFKKFEKDLEKQTRYYVVFIYIKNAQLEGIVPDLNYKYVVGKDNEEIVKNVEKMALSYRDKLKDLPKARTLEELLEKENIEYQTYEIVKITPFIKKDKSWLMYE